MDSIFRQILTSRVYDVAIQTPLDFAKRISNDTGAKVFLKREDLQPVFSFKIRGAYQKISSLNDTEKSKGIICASAGNHAQGVALSAKSLNIQSTVVMPA
ncbi:MAG: pyridoxal-phosphate dependent enzyme, partial [Leptonema sp. (in: Bacteria)]|nr:pyridoxal-phosphate dependent enzyme [Leptonema sp. (in: bacteria)]